MGAMPIATAYTLFAVLATISNILTQETSLRLYDGAWGIPISIAAGTATGLAVKYLLDKRYIFRFQTRDISHDARTFAMYATVGLATTTIFWGFELAFHALFSSKEMRYLGGTLGLAIGYLAKYQLDKRIVFVEP